MKRMPAPSLPVTPVSQHIFDTEMVLDGLHKLAQPLTSIRLCLDLALTPELGCHRDQVISDGLDQADRALRLLSLMREMLESSIPEHEAEGVEVQALITGVLSGTAAPQRFSMAGNRRVRVDARVEPLRQSLQNITSTCLYCAAEEAVIDVKMEFEVEHVTVRFEFVCSDVRRPNFALFSTRHDEPGSLAVAHALAQGAGCELGMEVAGPFASILVRLPLSPANTKEVQ